MAEGTLVAAELDLGRRLYEILRPLPAVRMEALFWWKEEDDKWHLYVVSPLVHEEGPLSAFRKMRQALQDAKAPEEVRELLERAEVMSPSEGLVTVIETGSPVKPPLNKVLIRESLGAGLYVEGAYFYHFAPQTFMVRS